MKDPKDIEKLDIIHKDCPLIDVPTKHDKAIADAARLWGKKNIPTHNTINDVILLEAIENEKEQESNRFQIKGPNHYKDHVVRKMPINIKRSIKALERMGIK